MSGRPSTLPSLRRPLVWLLVVACLFQAPAVVLSGLFGPVHRHHGATAAVGPWDTLVDAFAGLRAWRAGLEQRWLPQAHRHVHGPGTGHTHDAWQRHHHGIGDASVHALEGPGAHDSGSPASTAGAALTLALAPPAASLPGRVAAPQAWRRVAGPRWSDAPQRPEVPPPRG